jgi:hypothetical protein
MPFNSRTYYRNKERREAMAYLAKARASGEPEAVAFNVKLARLHWKTYLGHLRMQQCDADLKRFQRGEITYADFMGKWDIRNG